MDLFPFFRNVHECVRKSPGKDMKFDFLYSLGRLPTIRLIFPINIFIAMQQIVRFFFWWPRYSLCPFSSYPLDNNNNSWMKRKKQKHSIIQLIMIFYDSKTERMLEEDGIVLVTIGGGLFLLLLIL